MRARRARLALAALALLPVTPSCGSSTHAAPTRTAGTPVAAARAAVHRSPAFEARHTEITFDASGRAIAGTLTTPVAPGRHPALLVIAGSGPTDRDWCNPLMPGTNGSARLLATELARRGVVVLRYDKLAIGRTPAPASGTVSWSDYVAEQHAARAFLVAHESVDPAHVFLAGHSEGGIHAIHLLEQPGETFAGLVLLSSAGRRMADVMLGQIEASFRHAGVTGAMLDAQMSPLRSALSRFIGGEAVDPRTVSEIPALQQLFASLFEPAGAGFARMLLDYDPAAALGRLRVPVLVLNGGRDIQVSPTLDARPLADAAERGGNLDVSFHVAPEADHVLKHQPIALDRLDPATVQNEYNADGRVLDDELLSTLVAWLAAHAG